MSSGIVIRAGMRLQEVQCRAAHQRDLRGVTTFPSSSSIAALTAAWSSAGAEAILCTSRSHINSLGEFDK